MFNAGLLHDVRVAFQGLLKARALTFVVVLTLAVAIGANAAIFSVVRNVLLQPLPYPDEDRIVRVAATVYPSGTTTTDRGNPFSLAGYGLFLNNNRSFEAFGGYLTFPQQLPLTGDGPPLQVHVALMSLNAFAVLGVFPPQAHQRPYRSSFVRAQKPVAMWFFRRFCFQPFP